MKEPILEPILRKMRIRRVFQYIANQRDCRLLDIGCGWNAKLLHDIEPYISVGVGLDLKVPEFSQGKIRTEQLVLTNHLPYVDNSFDIVTMLAVLEHLEDPDITLREIRRVLVPGGKLLITVPSKFAQPVLEFLAFRLRIVSREEILDHKIYYNRKSIKILLEKNGFTVEIHRYFQLGMNNFLVAIS